MLQAEAVGWGVSVPALEAAARRADITAALAQMAEAGLAAPPTREAVVAMEQEPAADAEGEGLRLTGAEHLPGFGGGSDLSALNPLRPGGGAGPLDLLRGLSSVAETVGYFSAGAAGAGISKGLRDLEKLRGTLAALASSLGVSEAKLVSSLAAVPELKQVLPLPLLNMLLGAADAPAANPATPAAPGPTAGPTPTVPAASPSVHAPRARDEERVATGDYASAADDEMERVWRTESVVHAIGRSRLLLPISSAATTRAEAEAQADALCAAGMTSVVLRQPSVSRLLALEGGAAVLEALCDASRGLCVGLEVGCEAELAQAELAGARFAMQSPGVEAATLLAAADGSRLPIIARATDRQQLVSALPFFGLPTTRGAVR